MCQTGDKNPASESLMRKTKKTAVKKATVKRTTATKKKVTKKK